MLADVWDEWRSRINSYICTNMYYYTPTWVQPCHATPKQYRTRSTSATINSCTLHKSLQGPQITKILYWQAEAPPLKMSSLQKAPMHSNHPVLNSFHHGSWLYEEDPFSIQKNPQALKTQVIPQFQRYIYFASSFSFLLIQR